MQGFHAPRADAPVIVAAMTPGWLTSWLAPH